MDKFICPNSHVVETEADAPILCPECKQINTFYWTDTPLDKTYGVFLCEKEYEHFIPGIQLKPGKSCGFEYMGLNDDIRMCPICGQLNKAVRYINDKRGQRDAAILEKEARGDAWGEPEKVTHFRQLNGKEVAVTNKGKVKPIKDTEYANDKRGLKKTGNINIFGEETAKAKKTAHRGDYKL